MTQEKNPTPAPPERLPRDAVTVIATLLAATFVVILNETIMSVALNRLMLDLGVGSTSIQWLATGFMLTMAVVIPTTGFILQRLTTRQAFVLAMGLFCAGTTLAAAAPGFAVLLLARIVQACGTAIMLPLLMTTILTLVPVARRGQIMGNITIVIAVAPALGPTVSGVILAHFHWRFLFLFVLPVALAATAVGWRYLRNLPGERARTRLDAWSVALTVPAFGGLVYGLSQVGVPRAGHAVNTPALLALAVGGVALALFIARQLRLQRREAPLLDLRAFKYRMFTVATALMVVAVMALFGSIILLPLYLQTVLGLDPQLTGLTLLPGGLLMGLSGPFIGRLFDKVGPLPLTVSGSVLLLACFAALSQLTAATALWWIVVVQTCLNLGLALLFTPAFTTGLNPLPPHLYSHGSAILTTLQQLGGAAGTALLVSIYALVTAGADAVAGMRAAYTVAAGLAVVAVVLASLLRRTGPDMPPGVAEPAARTERPAH